MTPIRFKQSIIVETETLGAMMLKLISFLIIISDNNHFLFTYELVNVRINLKSHIKSIYSKNF